MTALTVGPRALELIKSYEGVRLKAYRCPAGIPTIGYGMTRYPDGRPVKMGDTITQVEADRGFAALLEDDFAAPLREMVAGASGGTLPREFGALASLVYNIGIKAFGKSTLLKLHRAGDKARAADEFLRWNKAGGRVLPGLTRRRAAERRLYLGEFDA